MNLVLRRRPPNERCTIGELYNDGLFLCFVLEDVVREMPGLPVEQWKVAGETAIPQGRYRVTITPSKRFKRDLPLLNMVPGFSGVRIHPGNTAADTEGCLLPGTRIDEDGESVLHSRIAFDRLYQLIDAELMAGEAVWIDVRNA